MVLGIFTQSLKKVKIFVLVIILTIVIYMFDLTYFNNNDDLLQFLIVSGIMFGEPNNALIFVASPFAYLFKYLYIFAPNIGW